MADEKSGPEQIETVGGNGPLEPTVAGVDPPPSPGDDAALPVVSPDLYAREGEVARGGMGRIMAARDRRLGRAVALKELHQESASSARRFVREALVTARLQHPSIVPVYEAGRWPEGVPFYAMKMVSGRSLDAVIRSTPTLAGRLALLPHVIAVAEAIAYAHSERIIHRDLKPANVLVGSFGETVVVDWGLAKDLSRPAGDDPSAERLPVVSGTDATIVGTVLGTPHYMPPEQARGEGVDERADVYALGAILYYLMTGAPPHAGKTATEALCREALGLYDAAGMGEGLDGALAKSLLGSTLQVLGRFDEAERFHRAALATERRLLGSDDARIATSVNNVAVVLGERGNWAAAEPLHREALEIMRRIRGQEHIEVAAAMRTLATVLESQNKFDEAEGLFRDAAAMCRKLLGPEHPDTAWTLYNHAFLLRRKGDPQGAAEKAREVLVLRGRSLNESHPVVAAAEQVVALSLIDLGRPKEAEPLLRDSLALRRRSLPAGHWLIATAEGALGVCLTKLRRFAEAESSLLSSHAGLRAAHGDGHQTTVEARQRLVALYEAWGKPQKAVPYRTTAVREEPSAGAGL